MTNVCCHLCAPEKWLPLGELYEHLLAEHDVDMADVARWPDGEPVVLDETLEPDDFA